MRKSNSKLLVAFLPILLLTATVVSSGFVGSAYAHGKGDGKTVKVDCKDLALVLKFSKSAIVGLKESDPNKLADIEDGFQIGANQIIDIINNFQGEIKDQCASKDLK